MRYMLIMLLIPCWLIAGTFENYWYQGAEISTYDLSQYRYGEIHKGTAVLIYVTENFLKDQQVKHEYGSKENAVPILKLNKTRNFLTGIYPYSTMTSIFHPVEGDLKPLKVNASIQEWCGHTWLQMNHRDGWYISSYSYFQKAGDQFLNLPEIWVEEGLWTLLRLDPKLLPTGEFKILPSILEIRFAHSEIHELQAKAEMKEDIYFHELKRRCSLYALKYWNARELNIYFESQFPYRVLGWKESYSNQPNGGLLKTVAVLKEQKITDYWNQNQNIHRDNRKALGLGTEK